ncbi:acetate uptake transporter [Streptomyces sp. NPDC002018]|uniref:acetate uptake transporter n=1 Tax=Streptomyces sp. NPDC002018 TaxID=3364629 RepID=UPI00369BD6DE
MDNDVSAGSTTSTSVLGHLALGLTLLAFGIGHTAVIDGVTAADAVTLALYVGGVALFAAGLLALRAGDAFTGTAFAGLGAFWFTWGTGVGEQVSADAAGLFLLLWALLALSLTLGAAGAGPLLQGTYGLLCAALLLLAVGQFADSSVLAKAGGWVAALAGLAAWYGATAALANWPSALPRRHAAGRGVTATG